jgi:transposase-like protein
MSKTSYRRSYPEQFRRDAVALVRSSGRPGREIGRGSVYSYESRRTFRRERRDSNPRLTA